jgi:hypothetical protein
MAGRTLANGKRGRSTAKAGYRASASAHAIWRLCRSRPEFLSGMLPVVGHEPKFLGRVGKELDGNAGRDAARAAALNILAAAQQHLGSLDKVARIVKLGVFNGMFLAKTKCPLGRLSASRASRWVCRSNWKLFLK